MKYYLDSDIDEIVTSLSSSLTKLSGKTILITGAAGFLGRYFVATLQRFNESTENPVSILASESHILYK